MQQYGMCNNMVYTIWYIQYGMYNNMACEKEMTNPMIPTLQGGRTEGKGQRPQVGLKLTTSHLSYNVLTNRATENLHPQET